eukprot:scaffold11952_cov20-Tisochrysis_lutea.AAC.1
MAYIALPSTTWVLIPSRQQYSSSKTATDARRLASHEPQQKGATKHGGTHRFKPNPACKTVARGSRQGHQLTSLLPGWQSVVLNGSL